MNNADYRLFVADLILRHKERSEEEPTMYRPLNGCCDKDGRRKN